MTKSTVIDPAEAHLREMKRLLAAARTAYAPGEQALAALEAEIAQLNETPGRPDWREFAVRDAALQGQLVSLKRALHSLQAAVVGLSSAVSEAQRVWENSAAFHAQRIAERGV